MASKDWIGRFVVAMTLLHHLGASSAQTPDWHRDIPDAHLVGQGEMHWFGLRIYQAALWSASGHLDDRQPFALALTYQRHITRDRLVETSMDEINRLGLAPTAPDLINRWRSTMRRAFIDVAPGDQLIGVYLPDYGCRFYTAGRQLADVPDPQFAKAFFDIWLAQDSRDPSLRKQLLGEQQ